MAYGAGWFCKTDQYQNFILDVYIGATLTNNKKELNQMKTITTIVCLAGLLFFAACGEDEQQTEVTPVRFAFAYSATQGDGPYTLIVTVSGEGMSSMTAKTTFTGKSASVEFPDIPSGSDRVFSVEVKDKVVFFYTLERLRDHSILENLRSSPFQQIEHWFRLR